MEQNTFESLLKNMEDLKKAFDRIRRQEMIIKYLLWSLVVLEVVLVSILIFK